MPGNLAKLRSEVELALTGCVTPFDYSHREIAETVSSGIPEIDSLTGGLPRGGLTEICGPPSSGRSSFLASLLASRTAHADVCALVDGCDSFDPQSASAAGVRLKRLLWTRCRNINQALRATDLLLQGRGFGLVALDLSGIAPRLVRNVPLNVWFRFRRVIEGTPTILILLEQSSNAKTCASLVLQLRAQATHWMTTLPEPAGHLHPSARFLGGSKMRAETLRSRVKRVIEFSTPGSNSASGIFQTKTPWSIPQPETKSPSE